MTVAPPARTPHGLALAALLLGAASLLGMAILFFALGGMTPLVVGGALGVLALVTGGLALRRRQSRALAISGIVLGAVSLILGIGLLVFALLFVGALTFGS